MNKENVEKIKNFFINFPGYLKKNSELVYIKLSSEIDPKKYFPVTYPLKIKEIQQELRKENKQLNKKESILPNKSNPKVLIFDLETSPNIVFSWNIGNKISLSMDNIIDERKIICIGYKWLGEKETHCVNFNINNQEDKWMLIEFAKVLNSAEYILGHNIDAYDLKFLRSRCIKHKIQINPKFNSIDTLKEAKKQFRFNSNKLDYLAQFLGLGAKIHTEYNLWKEIILNKSQDSLNKMIEYCKHDVDLTEQVYTKLEPFLVGKKYKYVKR